MTEPKQARKGWIEYLIPVVIGLMTTVIIGAFVFWNDVSASIRVLSKEDIFINERITVLRSDSEKADVQLREQIIITNERIETVRIETNETLKDIDEKMGKILDRINALHTN